MAIGELFLGASLQVLFDRLASRELLNFARRKRIHTDLKKWENKLLKIQAVLNDAEEKQIENSAVKLWLDDLRDLAYDVDDILDEFATEESRRKLTAEHLASTSKVQTLIPSCFTSLNPGAVMFNVRMRSKIKEITTRLQDLSAQESVLGLTEHAAGRSTTTRETLPTTSLPESCVHGREKDKEAIVELLLTSGPSDAEVCVIPILGMGGVGKTTLAQLVYNDDIVRGSFDLKAWVCVSDNFDIPSITKTILHSVTTETCDGKDLNWLQVKLQEKLSGQKFLIVLDDVWNEKYGDWTVLRKPFDAGAFGSRVIVTTRNLGVSSIMGTIPAYPLKELSYDDCLSILAQHALGSTNFNGHPNVKAVGEEIARRCKGLPLAAKTLGGVLRAKQNNKEWVHILNSRLWEEEGSVLPALKLSYHHLPSHLKQCFSYCAMFPKDFEFDKDELVLLWMSEGFLQEPRGNMQMEELGLEYFEDLLSRSFFQQTGSDNTRFVMHDLINDLAQSVSREICFNLDDNLDDNLESATFEKARYSSFIRHEYEVPEIFEVYNELKSLRSFVALPFTRRLPENFYISYMVLHDLLSKLRCLRVLSLSHYQISEVPDSIGGLKHLRYLNLSWTNIKELPESVGDLYNLQVLLLHGCFFLTKLPQSIGNLINLRHLDIAGRSHLPEMPLGIGSLTSLQKLSKFVVGKGDGLRIKELTNLLHLQGELSILGLHNVVDIQEARVANLKDKHGLEKLSMVWGDEFSLLSGNSFNDVSRNEEDEMHILDRLQPHRNLKELTIVFFGGKTFPSWIEDPSFSNIVRLHLRGCQKITSLPSLGRLPSLINLHIEAMGRVKSVGLEFYGDASPLVIPFPSLETLRFTDMLEWEEWSFPTGVEEPIEGTFSRLRELELLNCPNLIGLLPGHLTSLVKLGIRTCPQLAYSLVRLPSLCELKLEECNEMVLRSMTDLTSLATLRITRISGFKCLHEGLIQLLVALKVLEIEDCDEMTTLWQNEAQPANLACLEKLRIVNCPKLVSFPAGGVPSSLKSFVVRSCEALESLPDEMMMHGSTGDNCVLEQMDIAGCPSLKSFPRGKLPTSLKRLNIENCENLQSFPNQRMMHNDIPHLVELRISKCSSLTSFPTEEFPTAIKTLSISNCTQLEESVLERTLLHNNTSLEDIDISNWTKLKSLPDCLHNLTHLTSLYISDCPALESFPERGLPIPHLRTFDVMNCTSLQFLPNRMQNLTSLQLLSIESCPGIVSIPEGGLPPNLTSLHIKNCENLKQSMSEWGLHSLTSLREFSIGALQDMVSFPDDKHDCTLPTTLTSLYIESFPNLKILSRGLQNLTSLEELGISQCPKLRSLPKEGLPDTLGLLDIFDCPLLKQRCLKEEGEYLWDCNLLKQRCLKKEGEYWPIIAHIPCLVIDGDIL